jgi:uncharacterized membrane protein YfcA
MEYVGSRFLARRRTRYFLTAVALSGTALALHDFAPHALPASFFSGHTLLPVFLAALVCEYIDSALGMGYGTTLTPLLLLAGFEPLVVVPAILLSECVSGAWATLLHHRDRNVDLIGDTRARRAALTLALLSVVGATTAVFAAVNVPREFLRGAIGVIIVSVGVVILIASRRTLTYRAGHIMALGTVAAFNKGLSGGGYGPLVTGGQVLAGMSARQAVAITSLAESVTCLVGLIAYLILQGSLDWAIALPLSAGAFLAVPMATLTVCHLPERVIRTSVGVLTFVLGGLMLIKLLV